MSRFDYDGDGDGLPYWLWESNVSRALGGRRGQQALAEMEAALLALPEPKLVEGHLAIDGGVCAIGAYVAHKKAQAEGVEIAAVIEAMSMEVRCWCGHGKAAHGDNGHGHQECSGTRKTWISRSKLENPIDTEIGRYVDRPCDCDNYAPQADEEGAFPTAEAGVGAGLKFAVAWHLAYLNDEQFRKATPEERYEQMLAWVRRAQGKDQVAA